MGEPGEAGVVRRNFILNVLDGAVFGFGMSLVSRAAVLPVFVHRLGGDNVAVGLIPVIWVVGFNLPQLLAAGPARRAERKKPLMLRTALVQRLPWLLLAAAIYAVVDRVSPGAGLWLFFVGLGLAAVGGSLNFPVWFDLVARITPVGIRGRLFAVRTIGGALLGMLGGWIVERVLAAAPYPDGFALLFAGAFGAMALSYVFLAMLREEPAAVVVRERPPRGSILQAWRQAPEDAPGFRRFLVAEVLVVTALTAEAFFAVDALASFGLDERYAGRFTIVMMASTIAGTLLFGALADRRGHRLNLVTGALAAAAACAVALAAGRVEVYYAAFAAVALALSLRIVSQYPFVAELCGESDRSTYVALTNVVTAPFALAGLAAGWLANRHGYDLVFVLAGALSLSAAAWMALRVPEVRSRPAGAG